MPSLYSIPGKKKYPKCQNAVSASSGCACARLYPYHPPYCLQAESINQQGI